MTRSLCESRSSSLTVWRRGRTERGDQCPRPILNYCRDATLMSCLDRNVRNQPACRAEARSASRSKTRVRVRGALATGGWEPPGAWCLWTCTLVIDPLSWERRVGEKETEGLMIETIERASGWVVARRKRRLVTCRPSCLHKDRVLRLRFAAPQNIKPLRYFFFYLNFYSIPHRDAYN